jgi:hypothetical protein
MKLPVRMAAAGPVPDASAVNTAGAAFSIRMFVVCRPKPLLTVSLDNVQIADRSPQRVPEFLDGRLQGKGASSKEPDRDPFGLKARLQITKAMNRREIATVTEQMVPIHQQNGRPLGERARQRK